MMAQTHSSQPREWLTAENARWVAPAAQDAADKLSRRHLQPKVQQCISCRSLAQDKGAAAPPPMPPTQRSLCQLLDVSLDQLGEHCLADVVHTLGCTLVRLSHWAGAYMPRAGAGASVGPADTGVWKIHHRPT